MKKVLLQISLLFLALNVGFGQRLPHPETQKPNLSETFQAAPPKGEEKEAAGAKRQVNYFNMLTYPQTNQTAEDYINLWEDLDALPDEADFMTESHPKDWEYVGHYGATAAPSLRFTGRVTDIEWTNHAGLRVLSASGGLWQYVIVGIIVVPQCISDKLNNEWGGAFCTHPTDANTIFLGTGEPNIHAGTGMWKTVNGGKSWSKVTMSPVPTAFYKIAFHPTNPNIMWAATDVGLYKSSNGGTTWTRKRTGIVTDFVVRPGFPTQMFCSVWGDKFYKSINTGDTWTGMTTGGAPTVDVGRCEMAVTPANNQVIYAVVANNSNRLTQAIYKSTDAGATWIACNHGGTDFHWGQGWYNMAIAVSPTDEDWVVVGGGALRQSTDGFNFADIDGRHADQHALEFRPDASWLYLGNDGGIFGSSNPGSAIFNDQVNTLPISQFYHMSVGHSDPQRMGGGTQDDGMIYTKGAGYTWTSIAGDGSGYAVDPFNGNDVYAQNGIYSAGPASWNFRSTDGGVNWSVINNNMPAGGEWFPVIRTDHFAPTYQYTERDGRVYRTTNNGTNWFDFSPGGAPFATDVLDLTISRGAVPNWYACLAPPTNQLHVYDRTTGTWINRSAGLPTTGAAGTYVKKVVPSTNSSQPDVAYAVMGGKPTGAAKKVYKTTNRGATWVNMTGNLPNVACTDIIPHPTDPNVLVLGTEAGTYRTDDGGATWYHWWEGMPRSIAITEMDYVDSTAANGRFYVYCSTFGRGIWKREIGQGFFSGNYVEDRTEDSKLDEMPTFRLDQNLANASNGSSTAIPYYIGVETQARLSVFNENGQLVKVLVDGVHSPGLFQEEFQFEGLPSGVYFYRLEAGGWSDSKKMVIVK